MLKWMKSVLTWTPNHIQLFYQQYKMANRVSNDQLEELLDYLAEHPCLAKGVGLGARSKEAVDRQWNDLATKLNSFGSGSSKTGERWKKYWADLKHKVKTRTFKRRQDALGTGGGPSTQEDLSDVDKKVLAIIGENAVYGDSQHRIPIFNIEPEVPVLATVQPENIVVAEEVVITDTSEVHVPVATVSNTEMEAETQQVPEPHHTGVETVISQPSRRRPRPRVNQPSPRADPTCRTHPRIDPEWVMGLERSRVEAENKMANAIQIIAEAANKIADASLLNAETFRMNAEATRNQLEVLKTVADVVTQLVARENK